MINRVVLIGRLTRDPELRTTGSGISVATFSLAVDRQFTNAQGEREADFINCVIWRKSAENFTNFTSKGTLVGIEGRIQTRNYENNDGQRVYVTEVVVDNFSLLESKRSREARLGGATSPAAPTATQAPSNNGTSATNAPDPFKGSGDSLDISDDDLPF
ncbi:MAG: single-stranded DNA-binding protein [Lactobacillus sp.]|nr:single-stranded DNA-binding protein [Lactobacillus sp.]